MILFFDTETTGLNRSTARIVQLAWILSNSNGSEVSRSSMIIKPSGYSIPESAAAIHNITTAYALENGVPLKKCLKQMAELVDDVKLLVAHNISYDSSILKEEFHRAGLNYPFGKTPVVCTMKSSTEYCELPKNSDIPGYKYPKLEELYRHLFGYDFLDAHDALADAVACKQCYFELVKRGVVSNQYDWVSKAQNEIHSFEEKVVKIMKNEAATEIIEAEVAIQETLGSVENNSVALKSLERKIARKNNRIGALELRERFLKDEVSRLKQELKLANKSFAINNKEISKNIKPPNKNKPSVIATDKSKREPAKAAIIHPVDSHLMTVQDGYCPACHKRNAVVGRRFVCSNCNRVSEWSDTKNCFVTLNYTKPHTDTTEYWANIRASGNAAQTNKIVKLKEWVYSTSKKTLVNRKTGTVFPSDKFYIGHGGGPGYRLFGSPFWLDSDEVDIE